MSAARTPSSGTNSAGAAGGLTLAPFRGVRFDPAQVTDLAAATSPPYDVIDAESARRLEAADPHNVVRIILPRPGEGDEESRYGRAAATLRAWLAAGTLLTDPEPSLYVYEQRSGETLQRGLIGAVGLRAAADGVILPHEDVMSGPVADRLRLMRATAANPEPILLTYPGGGPASAVVDEIAAGAPLLTTRTEDDITHRLWRLTEPTRLARIADDLCPRQALIADGHHRYAVYLRLQEEHRAAGDGPGPWDHGLALLVDSTRYPPQLTAIHRTMPKLSPGEALAGAGEWFRVRPLDGGLEGARSALAAADSTGPAFVLAAAGRFWLLSEPRTALLERTLPRERSDDWRRLDAAVLHCALLDVVWHVPDRYPDVTYYHDAVAAVHAAQHSGGSTVLLRPVPEELVRRLAAAGERLPRKTTSFGPKPRNGLVLRIFATG